MERSQKAREQAVQQAIKTKASPPLDFCALIDQVVEEHDFMEGEVRASILDLLSNGELKLSQSREVGVAHPRSSNTPWEA